MNKWAALLIASAMVSLLASEETTTDTVLVGPDNPTLTWDCPIDPSVVGYRAKYGIVGGITNELDVGMTNVARLRSLTMNATHFMYVCTYNGRGAESDPSNVLLYQPDPSYHNTVATPAIIAGGSTHHAASNHLSYRTFIGNSATIHSASRTVEGARLSIRNTGASLRFEAVNGHRYAIQVSEDMREWTTLDIKAHLEQGLHEFIDWNAAKSMRFYRVLVETR